MSQPKQWISVILVFVLAHFASGQQISFTPQVADFGILHENTGNVFSEFVITNNSNQTYRVRGIMDPCGCVSSEIDTSVMPPSKKIKVRVGYNPSGRPGQFYKQVTLVLQQQASVDTLALDLYIKGTVLSKNDVPFTKLDLEKAFLKIKSLRVDTLDATARKAVNDFINDLTFVLDKDGFANITWQYNKTSAIASPDSLLKQLQKEISAGLLYRGYKNYAIGYKALATVVNDNQVKKPFIEFAVSGYTDNAIAQTTLSVAVTQYLNAENKSDSLYTLAEYCTTQLTKKINWQTKEQQHFVNESVRYAILNNGINIRLNISGVNPQRREQFLKNTVQQWVKDFVAQLNQEGIQHDKITILPVVFNSSENEKICFEIVVNPQQEEPVSWLAFQENLNAIRKKDLSKQQQYGIHYNNLPVFYQRVANQNYFDTTDAQFKEWVSLVLDKMKRSKDIAIAIEATASNSPTATKYDNGYVARKRLRIAQSLILETFKKRGLRNTEKLFRNTYALVKGPLYHEHDYLLQEFYKYQYIKLIAIETDTSVVPDKDQFPYQVNFNNNEFEIPTQSPVFVSFIESLIPYINKYGYVELIVESSSSKVPTRQYRSNRVLAFERLQRTKSSIQQALIDRGYNPLRVVFIEERIMVQGPAYKNNMDPQNEYFKEFQYVKIIPSALYK